MLLSGNLFLNRDVRNPFSFSALLFSLRFLLQRFDCLLFAFKANSL